MTESIFLIDEFVSVTTGEPYRLLPFGTITRNGKSREITPELARKFRLPHFKPPIKRGSHREETPAGGFIVGLEVRPDGLYAIPEWNDEGMAALNRGDYRYHSPEIIWEGAMEDASTGQLIEGPLIVGDALLHQPALGEHAALYKVEVKENETMTEHTVQVPANLWERFMARLFDEQPEPATPEPQKQPSDDYAAQVEQFKAERDQLAARVAEMEAEANHAARIDQFSAQLKETTLKEDAELHQLLADLTDEQAAPIVQRFKALSEQVRVSNLEKDLGGNDDKSGDPVAAFTSLIENVMTERKIAYQDAALIVAKEQPELYRAYQNKGGK